MSYRIKNLALSPRTLARARRQAQERQGSRYYEGQPCKRCGSIMRYVSNAACVRCVRERALQRHEQPPLPEHLTAEDLQLAYELRHTHGLSHAEIADKFDVPTRVIAVYTARHSA